MKIVYKWHLCEETVDLDQSDVPRGGESVVLTFPVGTPEHGFRVQWVRWYPMADPPYALVQVTQR